METFIVIFVVLAVNFSATPFARGPAGTAKFYWPFAADTKPWLGLIGGLPSQGGSMVTTLLAGAATMGLIAALLALFGWFVPANWLLPLIASAFAASIALDVVLLWGVLARGWSISGLK